MPRRTDDPTTPSGELTAEEWLAQTPCPECGGRPGRDPTTGIQLRIQLPNREYVEGHTYQCQKRRQE